MSRRTLAIGSLLAAAFVFSGPSQAGDKFFDFDQISKGEDFDVDKLLKNAKVPKLQSKSLQKMIDIDEDDLEDGAEGVVRMLKSAGVPGLKAPAKAVDLSELAEQRAAAAQAAQVARVKAAKAARDAAKGR